MNLKKNKTLVTIVVIFVAIGLVAAYIPFLFPRAIRAPQSTSQPPPSQPSQTRPQPSQTRPQTATLTQPPVEVEEVAPPAPDTISDSNPEDSTSETVIPEGFGGLEEESESLGELDSLLENFSE